MKNEVRTIWVILFLCTALSGQPPNTLWTKTFGGSGYDWASFAQQTLDGGFIIAGATESFGSGSFDVWLIKTDANGDTLWTKTFGGNLPDFGNSVQQTSDGGYIIAGFTYSFGGGDGDVWLIKTDHSGDTLWTKTFGGSRIDNCHSVQQTIDDGYIIIGSTYSFGAGDLDLWLIKTNPNGDTLWTKTFGESYPDWGTSVQQTSDNGYVITGHRKFPASGIGNVWLLKTDANGDTLWTKTFGGNRADFGNCVQQTTDGGYIITGEVRSFDAIGTADLWLIKTDDNGDSLWTKTFGGSGSDGGYWVQQTADGGYIIVGWAGGDRGYSDVWLIKTDANGDVLWTKIYDGNSNDVGYFVQQTNDMGYIIAGSTESFGAGGIDAWLIKIDADTAAIGETLNYKLLQNYPNPFNPTTNIRYEIGSERFVSLRVFGILGREIAILVNEKKPAGSYSVEFDGRRFSSGIYLYQMQADNFKQARKMILLK
jgi:Secretion system C-terminal sorting domain